LSVFKPLPLGDGHPWRVRGGSAEGVADAAGFRSSRASAPRGGRASPFHDLPPPLSRKAFGCDVGATGAALQASEDALQA
jgi:hypothetical protein